jgi:hypothetical protein
MPILCGVFVVFTVSQGEMAPTLKEAMNVFLKSPHPFTIQNHLTSFDAV